MHPSTALGVMSQNLMDVQQSRGNPFEESSADLVTLDIKGCDDKSAAKSVQVLESRGQEQCDQFRKNVLDTNNVSLQDPIKKNNICCSMRQKLEKRQHFRRRRNFYNNIQICMDKNSL